MGLLIVVLLVSWLITKTVSDAKTDRELARQGIVSPRLQAKYGPKEARARSERYGLADFVTDAWSDNWAHRTEARRAAHEAARTAEPGQGREKVRWRDRARAAKRAIAAGAKKAAPAVRLLVDPVPPRPRIQAVEGAPLDPGTRRLTDAGWERWDGGGWVPEPDGPVAGTKPSPRSPEPRRTADGDLYFGADPHDPNGVKQCGWCRVTGVVDGAPCERCRDRQEQRNADHGRRRVDEAALGDVEEHLPIEVDSRPGLRCFRCNRPFGEHAIAPDASGELQPWCSTAAVAVARTTAAQNTTDNPTNGGKPMAPTGEAVNYETTINELEKIADEQRKHVEQSTACEQRVIDAKAALDGMDESYRATAGAAASVVEHLNALNLDTTTIGHVGTAADAMPPSKVDELFTHLEAVEEEAKERKEAAEAALASTEAAIAHVTAEYGEMNANIAAKLGGDSRFVDSSGGAQLAKVA